MLYQYSDKKKILFDRSAFERLACSDIERVKTRFNILCPDVFLAECINPSKSARKKIIEEKILRFDSLLVFLSENSNEILSHYGIMEIINSGQFEDINLKCLQYKHPEVVLKSLSLKWLRDFMKRNSNDLNQRGYDFYVDGSNEGRSLKETIDFLSDNNDNVDKKKLKNDLKEIKMLGTSQEPDDIAKGVDIMILFSIFKEEIKTYEDLKKNIKTEVPYHTFNKRTKYLSFYDWMIYYMIMGQAVNMKGLDRSYFNDLMYCYYIPFCDLFVTDEKTFPLVLKPISDRFDFINFVTFNEFKDKFLK